MSEKNIDYKKTDKAAIKLRGKGLTYGEIAEQLSIKGLRTVTGRPITTTWVQSRLHWLKEKGVETHRISPKLKRTKNIPEMIEIPVAQEIPRIACITGTPDSIREFLRGWI